jgi:uncharacterized membrane protein YedE/YeeE
MNIVDFTPYSALAGGALIGLAAVLLLGLDGRVAGVSGILAGVVNRAPDSRWRIAFLVGLIAGAAIQYATGGHAPARAGFPPEALGLAGVLVGFGTALGSGCTSGHGVCGIARLSLRSLAATAIFLITAMITTFVVRHVLGVH